MAEATPLRESNNYVWGRQPGEDVVVLFVDKTGAHTGADVATMLSRLREVANEFGFYLSSWGTSDNFVSSSVEVRNANARRL